MTNIQQWLLVGGPGHGDVLHVKAGTSVLFTCRVGEHEEYKYTGQTYEWNGSSFRVGVHNPTPDQLAEVEQLICKVALKPFFTYPLPSALHTAGNARSS